ncbi:hypothetical protein [Sphingopyxis sp. 113P3]|uniref:hypothetical protein n=1 Tax=Sphingopyxis sp. (strain 113P3) TaxID=292913 RepID=UPI0006AD4222|nr:hypothetical protein [Sphingopyxis sp. 113P3]ALC13836.1 hypothetical protein LH20_17910 [Sphingopyxis sp. 113P3]
MCEPATLALAAAAVTAAGQGYAALQSAAASRYEARVADRNAKLENEAAFRASENTKTEALAHYRRVAQLKGEQRVAQAANGVSLDFGSAADVAADTDLLAREDAKRIYDQGAEAVRGFDISAANYRSSAKASRFAAKGAIVKGAFDMASTALNAASQYSKMKAS